MAGSTSSTPRSPTCATPLRGLGRRPGFAAAGALTLALGIGASTAIFSAVNPVLFEPLPYPHANRIVMLSDYGVGGGRSRRHVRHVSRGGRAESLVRRSCRGGSVAARAHGAGRARTAGGRRRNRAYFQTLGVAPAVGRDFDAADDQPGAPRVAILSDGLVRRRFGAAGQIVGRPVTLDGDEYAVIGVMPAGFDDVLSPSADVWAPRRYRADAPFQSAEWGHHMRMVGRLAPGVSTAAGARRDCGHRRYAASLRSRARRGRPWRKGSTSSRCRRRSRATCGRRCWPSSPRSPSCSSSPGSTSPISCSRAAPSGTASSPCARRSARTRPARAAVAHRESRPRPRRRRARARRGGAGVCARWWRSRPPGCRAPAPSASTPPRSRSPPRSPPSSVSPSASCRRSRARAAIFARVSSPAHEPPARPTTRCAAALVVAEMSLALVLLVGAGLMLRSLHAAVRHRARFRRVAGAHHAGRGHRSSVRRGRRAAPVLRAGARRGSSGARRR